MKALADEKPFRPEHQRTSSVHGGKLATTSHVLILIICGMILQLIVEAVRYGTTDDCLRGAWMLTGSPALGWVERSAA